MSQDIEQPEETTGRRRLLAGLTGLATVLAAKFAAPSRAEAAAEGSVTGASTSSYGLAASPGAGAPILPVVGATSHGLIGSNTGVAVVDTGSGVLGARNGGGLAGVFGVNASSGYGVLGRSESGQGVRGEIASSSASNAYAVFGLNNSTYVGPNPGAGGFGVYGHSQKGHGLVGSTGTAGGAAVVGATNGVAGAYAGVFYGTLAVVGDFVVIGGAKSGAVPHPDGTTRQLYAVEAPESWFEDFGTGRLTRGRAEILLDPDFAAIAEVGEYHVFLTSYERGHMLEVTERTTSGFTVEANAAFASLQGRKPADASGTFSWRVVAKRRDIVGERLARVQMPDQPQMPSHEVAKPGPGRER